MKFAPVKNYFRLSGIHKIPKMDLAKYFDTSYILYLYTRWVTILKCAPLKISPSSGHSFNNFKIIAKNTKELKKSTVCTYLNYIASFVHLWQLLYPGKQQFNPTDLVLAWFAWLAIFFNTSLANLCRKKGQLWENYQNNLFAFKQGRYTVACSTRKNKFSDMSTIEYLNLLFAPMLIISCALEPFLYVTVVHWNNSCKPSLIGYFILSECYNQLENQLSLVQKLCQFLLKTVLFLGNI